MPKIMRSILLVALFAGLAGNLDAQGVSFQPAVNFTITPPGCRGICFEPAVNYPAGLGPWSVAVSDFNRDGVADLVVANAGSNNVLVYLGKGDGTFRVAGSFRVGVWPWSVAVGKFRGAEMPDDLAVVNWMSDSVSVLLGNGDGSFQEAQNFAVGSHPQSVAVSDFNGDGLPDLVVTNSGSRNLSVLLGNGDGTFQTPQNFGVDGYPRAVAVGDFNGDGLPDLAVVYDVLGIVSVLLGNGDGTFRPAENYDAGDGLYPSVIVAKFRGVGMPDDLAVASGLNGKVSVLLGNGDGTFEAAQNFDAGVQPWSEAVGDFNGDGLPDVAVASLGYCDEEPCDNSGVSVLLGNGDGTFQGAVNFNGVAGGPRSVAVGDFNGDGLPDLAVADSIPSRLVMLINCTPPR